MKQELSYDIIKAACDGDIEARNKIVEHYSDYIDELSGGDEDMRQALILKLLEEIPKFDCENPENNEKLLQELE
ncbi:MAG: helix-turn-helix domain-containing protein [Clostridia bacterium]|nr:helix-turn-helix domain-containing protein [Lachnospiraceae bacterium]MBR1970252.1 helix-turn-helix domain-containing protein [Clostridia bacterium]